MVVAKKIRDNVDLIESEGRSIYLVGTAHISQKSADLVQEVIREIKPETVAIELCQSRFQSMRDPDRWRNTDIISVIKSGRAYVLLAQLLLAGFQKRLGKQLKVRPGLEMLTAVNEAEAINANLVMADREVRITLKRTWSALGLWSLLKLVFSVLVNLFEDKKVSEEEIEQLKSADALEALMKEFSDTLPEVRTALIDERDLYLKKKIKDAPGKSIVAVVGAGHISGIIQNWEKEVDMQSLEKLPKPRRIAQIILWSIPALVLVFLVYAIATSGTAKGLEILQAWFWTTGLLGAIGAALMLAHPLTVIATFISSPFATLTPIIRAGWISGLVEAIIKKPRVADFETIADDVFSVRGLFTNRVSRVLLVIISVNLLTTAGMVWGAKLIASIAVN